MTGNPDCNCTKHVFHICALKACGLEENDADGLGKLISNPKFKCKTCENTANKAENLCNPEKL